MRKTAIVVVSCFNKIFSEEKENSVMRKNNRDRGKENEKLVRKKLRDFLKRRRREEFVCPFRGPCNAVWEKESDNGKFNLYRTEMDGEKWTRIGFHAKFWEKNIIHNPNFLTFISTKACRPSKEIVKSSNIIVWLTFLSKYQKDLWKCF